MKKLYSILTLILISFISYAQPYETNPDFNRTRNWHFGHGVGLRFDPDTIYEVPTSIHTDESTAVHTDADGNLLLYSNGQTIWNANHKVIHNGNLALGSKSSKMGATFVSHIDNPDSIYLFATTPSPAGPSQTLSFNLIVIEADTFRVVIKDSILLVFVCNPISTIKAENEKDIWVVVHGMRNRNIHSFLLTSNGVVSCAISSPSKSIHLAPDVYFEIIFSTDGKYLLKQNDVTFKKIEVYEFDRFNGTCKFLFTIDHLNKITGLGFSKNSLNLFTHEKDVGFNVFQFNPTDSTLTSQSKKTFQISGLLGEMRNHPYSDKIIFPLIDSANLFYLKNTNDYDLVSLENKSITNTDRINTFGLPNFNHSFYHTPSINFSYKLNCYTNTIQFMGQDTFLASSHLWLISRDGSVPITGNIKNPLIEFIDTGVYNVKYIASNGIRTDSFTKKVTILEKANKNFLGIDTGWCNAIGDKITLNAPSGMLCYEWSDGYYESYLDERTFDTTGLFWAKITTPNFCVLYDTINIVVDSIPERPIIYQHNDTLKTEAIAKGYQWYKNNQPIGTNNNFIKITDTGVYFLKTISNGGCESESDTLHVFRVGVNKIEKLNVIVYPNPFNDELNIEAEEYDKLEIIIFNLLGQEILKTSLKNQIERINTAEWKQGVYFMEITQQNGIKQTFKFIKMN